MKRKMMLCSVVLVLGLLAIGCGDDESGIVPAVDNGSYYGTVWTGTDAKFGGFVTLTFTQNSGWEMTSGSDSGFRKGTYTASDAVITLTATHEWDDSENDWAEVSGDPEDYIYEVTVTGTSMTVDGVPFTKFFKLAGTKWTATVSFPSEGKVNTSILTFTSENEFMKTGDGDWFKGTYVYSGADRAITLTSLYASYDDGATWINNDTSDYPYPVNLPVFSGTVSVDHTKITFDDSWSGITFTKQP